MKVLLIADVNSLHTIRWATSLSSAGIDVGIFDVKCVLSQNYKGIKNISLFPGSLKARYRFLSKILYLLSFIRLRSVISKFKPDIVHAHYATGYGLLGLLSGFHPYILSVWGSDVYLFPRKNIFAKKLLMNNLNSADYIYSTSKDMAIETRKYTKKNIIITPFGVDLEKFDGSVTKKNKSVELVIGIVKSLEKVYGIQYLIYAFKKVKERNPQELKLLIVGDGSKRCELEKLTKKLGIESSVEFYGRVPLEHVPIMHKKIDIAVFPSLSESFGVSALEASASGKPIIVTNVGGHPEVVRDGITGFLVPPCDVESLVLSIEKLVNDSDLRYAMGTQGRKFVEENYSWDKCVRIVVKIYNEIYENKDQYNV